MTDRTDRRRFLTTSALLGTVGAGAFISLEETALKAAEQEPEKAKPRQKVYEGETLPCGKIGKYSVSRLMMGGNLIGGFAHSRDLLYVSRLLREYNTESKIFETLELAEQSGINTIQIGSGNVDVVSKYRKERGGKIQMMVCVDTDFADPAKIRDQVKWYIDMGVEMIYTHGENTDRRVMAKEIDILGKVLELMKASGVPAGIGSHSLETPIASEKNGLNPDFYVKTFHSDNYWSATPEDHREEWCWYNGWGKGHDGYNDNMYCLNPVKTAEFMATVNKPWVAFKVMAAGAMSPQIGFNFAFQGGADFVIAGMFDFQVAEDVEIAVKALRRSQKRERPWRA